MAAKVTYRILSPDEREQDRLERHDKARRDQAAQQRWAIKQREFELARNLLKMNMPMDDIVRLTNLTVEEIEGLDNVG